MLFSSVDTPPRLDVQSDSIASVEIGNAYIGIALHKNRPLLQRISFYSPVANSIDLSTDYWTRNRTHAMILGLKTGGGSTRWIGLEPFRLELTPYRAFYSKETETERIEILYRFSDRSPVMFVTYIVTNNRPQAEDFEWYTHLEASIRTSHTFATKSSVTTETLDQGQTIIHRYQDPETANAELFVSNMGLQPVARNANSHLQTHPAPEEWWSETITDLSQAGSPLPAFRYLYRATLKPGESMTIHQMIGSSAKGTAVEWIQSISDTWEAEIRAHEATVLDYADRNRFVTGDSIMDHSVRWANSILAVNQHHIDGTIQPMPCPAEYNFYFTHDVLLTDLAAVNFDTERVRRDLKYILELATDDFVIPHAYYWKDDRFVTEFATPDNWNHFWFVIVSGSYLRRSGDIELLKELYPYLEKSVSEFMTHLDKGMIHSFRPDWWDIARNYGPRSYTTILADKALREFMYITSRLTPSDTRLPLFEQNSMSMKAGLNDSLWVPSRQYYMNYFEDGSMDEHYYQGPLLAAHYGLADSARVRELISTAQSKIVDPLIGVYTVYPMDFKELIDYLKLVGNEAGDANTYLNGGIWPHGNAWYAMALISAGQKQDAREFIRSTMTVKGVMDSPNGYPAMFEYRVSDKTNSSVYGKIDKPQFMWAAGWYLYSLYQLHGIRESEWNVRFEPFLDEGQDTVEFDLMWDGSERLVRIHGQGDQVGLITVDGRPMPSAVLPVGMTSTRVDVQLGDLIHPTLMELEAVLLDAHYDEVSHQLDLVYSSFIGHHLSVVIHAEKAPKEIRLNGERIRDWEAIQKSDRLVIRLNHKQKTPNDRLILTF